MIFIELILIADYYTIRDLNDIIEIIECNIYLDGSDKPTSKSGKS